MRTLRSCSLPLVLLLATASGQVRAGSPDPSDSARSGLSPADSAGEMPLTQLAWRVARNWRRANNPLDEPVRSTVPPFVADVPGALHPVTRHLGAPLPWGAHGFLQAVLEHGSSVAPRGQKLVAWLMALLKEEKEGGALSGPALPQSSWGPGPLGGGRGGLGRGSMGPGGGGGGMGGGGGGGGGGSGGGGGGGSGAGGSSGTGTLVGGAQSGMGSATGSGDPGAASPSSVPGTLSPSLVPLGSGGSQGSQNWGGATPPSGAPPGSGGYPGVHPSAPEIDPGGAAGALAVLVGGVLLLTDRLRRRG